MPAQPVTLDKVETFVSEERADVSSGCSCPIDFTHTSAPVLVKETVVLSDGTEATKSKILLVGDVAPIGPQRHFTVLRTPQKYALSVKEGDLGRTHKTDRGSSFAGSRLGFTTLKKG